MSPLADDSPEDRPMEMLFLWATFCQDVHEASVMPPSVELADRFADWVVRHQVTDETRGRAATWWSELPAGSFRPELEIVGSWMAYSSQGGSPVFVRVSPTSARGFANWLADQEPASRTRVEELDLSVRAFNVLRSRDVRFVDQIDVRALDDPIGRRVRAEIVERLRRWRGDSGEAGAPVPR
jgi:hypothetical protein